MYTRIAAMHRICFLIPLLTLGWLPAAAQSNCPHNESTTQMQIQLTIEAAMDDSADSNVGVADAANNSTHGSGSSSGEHSHQFSPDMNIRVELQDSFGTRVGDAVPNGEGRASFTVCPRAEFRLRVTGSFIEEATAENLSPGRGDHMVNIALHRKGDRNANKKGGKGAVSASRLRIPRSAQKEMDRGNAALAGKDLPSARSHFEKAIALYKDFDQAYNNLGVVLMQQGDLAGGETAFAKAISVNDHFARALTNLARIALDRKDFGKALTLAQRSLSSEPLNPKTLLVGTEAAYFSGDYDTAVGFVRTLHSLPHQGMGLAHYLSGRSLEKQGHYQQAISEYHTFLAEDPNDPNVSQAQMAISELEVSTKDLRSH
jgi:tetratricopeptide (TPR) repeat protein